MSLNPGIYYVKMLGSEFLCDFEWDGDSFGKNTHSAIKRSEPWFDGGRLGTDPYKCVPVRLWFDEFEGHEGPSMKSFQSRKGGKLATRFRVECPRCKWSTKRYAQQMTAISTWNATKNNHPCRTERWEFAK